VNIFSHSWLLWFLPLVPVLGILSIYGWRQRRRALALLGNVPAIQAIMRRQRGRRFLRGACFFLGIVVVIVGAAGPQWGLQHDPETAVAGRDLVVVLDLSRSMLAEQPSRQERARRALRDLADTLQLHGGHRVALVVFAARPRLVFPLTNDYDHFRESINAWDADNLPPELRPNAEEGPVSGTRIGAALRLAAASHDVRFAGAQDIVLLSDGDDPAQDRDREWAAGIVPAQKLKIPIHVLGLGDPDQDHFIPFRDGFLKHNQVLVKTRLQEKPLQEIANQTGGIYLPARNRDFRLGRFFRDVLEPRGVRTVSEVESTTGLPIPKQQYPWFLGTALVLLTCSMLISDRSRSRRRWPVPAGLWLIPLALILISAAPPDAKQVTPSSPVDHLIQKGNTAYEAEDFDGALKLYEQAEERSIDPGLVAFNKAAALYRRERYAEAARHYQRCLEDKQAPPLRLARGYYDLGNCLVKQAGPADVKILEEALVSYRECLALAAADDGLKSDARHNLELATLLWLKAKTAAREKPSNGESKDDHKPKDPVNEKDPGSQIGKEKGPGTKGEKIEKGDGPEDKGGQKKLATPGKILNLPDQDELVKLPPEDTSALLEQAAQRILNERREYRRQSGPVNDSIKDW
jgi:Ca-activated chloride channel family protein